MIFHPSQKVAVHPISLFRDKVRFIHDDEIKFSKTIRISVCGLNSGDNAFIVGVPSFQSGGINSDIALRVDRMDFIHSLFQQLFYMGKDHHSAIPLLYGIFYNRRQNRCFTSGCRNHHAWIIIITPEIVIYGINCLLLILA